MLNPLSVVRPGEMRPCKCVPARLMTTLLAFGTGFVVEGVLFYLIVADLVKCEHVVCALLGLVVGAGILSWVLLWIKRVERQRDAKRKECLLKDRPPARQHRVHPFAFEPASVDSQPLTYKQLFEPDQLLKTLLPRRQVALCEVHQYNDAESHKVEVASRHKRSSLPRSRSLPLLLTPVSSPHSDTSDYRGDRRWNTK